MKIESIDSWLGSIFPNCQIEHQQDVWQIKSENFHLLVVLSADRSWLRLLVPIASEQEAKPLLSKLLAANFDETQEVRYALAQNVLWGVFHHQLDSLTEGDFQRAIASLVALVEKGISDSFREQIETQIRQIIKVAKARGQSLETTYQTLDRFYQEGILGGVDQKSEEREQFLRAWKDRLESLWEEG
jgi:hypothetical protein